MYREREILYYIISYHMMSAVDVYLARMHNFVRRMNILHHDYYYYYYDYYYYILL